MHSYRWIAASIFVLTLGCMSSAHADCTVPSTPNDGYFDQTWAGHGCIVFDGDNGDSTATTQVDKIVPGGGDSLLLGGDGTNGTYAGYWWAGQIDASGNFITTFGDSDASGRITECKLGIPCGSDGKFDFVLQADGKLVVVSAQHLARTGSGAHALDTAGVSGGTGYVDSSFTIGTPSGVMYASDFGGVAVAPGGKLYAAGFGYPPSASFADFGIARLGTDLTVDTTFNAAAGSGITYAGGNFIAFGTSAAPGDARPGEATQILPMADGRLVLSGYSAYRDILVARVNVNGSIDANFNATGPYPGSNVIVSLPSGITNENFSVRPAALDRAGRTYFAIDAYQASTGFYGALATRFKVDGTQDTGFGTSGWSYNNSFTACPNNGFMPNVLAIDNAGRILVAGTCDSEFGVIRLRGDTGALDTSWGISGMSHGHFDSTSNSETVKAIAFDGSGHLFIGGSTHPSGKAYQSAVARLTYDLVYTNNFEEFPDGCLPPNCN